MHHLSNSIGLHKPHIGLLAKLSFFFLVSFIVFYFLGPSRRLYCISFYLCSNFFVIYVFFKNNQRFIWNKIIGVAALYAVILISYLLGAGCYTDSLKAALYFGVLLITLPIMISNILNDRLCKVSGIISALSAGIAFLFYISQEAYEGRLSYFFINTHPLQTGAIFFLSLVVLFDILYRTNKSKSLSWLYLALYLISLAIALTYSRSALFALILTWIIALCFVGEAFKKRLVGICILVALSFICIEHQTEINTENDIYIKESSYDWMDNNLRWKGIF